MIPILATILAQAANVANQNLSRLKQSGKNSGYNAAQAAQLAQQIQNDMSGISNNGVV